MYLHPRQVFQKFLVEEKRSTLNEIGRQIVEYIATGDEIFAVVSSAEPKEVERWLALGHTVSHILIQHLGRVKAKVGDRLIRDDRKFYIEAIDDPAGLGQFYIYYCSERFDL